MTCGGKFRFSQNLFHSIGRKTKTQCANYLYANRNLRDLAFFSAAFGEFSLFTKILFYYDFVYCTRFLKKHYNSKTIHLIRSPVFLYFLSESPPDLKQIQSHHLRIGHVTPKMQICWRGKWKKNGFANFIPLHLPDKCISRRHRVSVN